MKSNCTLKIDNSQIVLNKEKDKIPMPVKSGDILEVWDERGYVKHYTKYPDEFCDISIGSYFNKSGKRIVINDYLADNINKLGQNYLIEIAGIIIPVRLLKLIHVNSNDEKYNFSIKVNEKKREIIDEMISKVDVNSLSELLRLGTRERRKVKEEVLNWYLEKWANAKYEYYIAFGHKLKISDIVEQKASDKELKSMISNMFNIADDGHGNDLRYFSIYKPVFDRIPIEAFSENRCLKNELFENMCEQYKVGMKLSKFISQYFLDSFLDIEVSKILQNRIIKGEMSISIDPIDYLTSAINKNGWTTCQSIYAGMHACAPFSIMLDEETLVVYKANNIIYNYDIRGCKFKANSKTVRSFVSWHKDGCSFALHRSYPDSSSENMYDAFYDFTKKVIGKVIDNNEWYTTVTAERMDSGHCNGAYENIINSERHHKNKEMDYMVSTGGHIFLDPIKCVCSPENRPIGKFNVGVAELKCPVCGKTLTKLYNGAELSCGAH